MNPDAALDFLSFVAERHRIWEKRQAGDLQPWTDDPILARKSFTNVFRILDHGTQFLLNELLDPDLSPRDTLMRCFLYRHTGRPEAWEYLETMGGYPLVEDLEYVRKEWQEYKGASKRHWSGSTTPGGEGKWGVKFERSVFTGAYLVFPQTTRPGTDKLDSIIELTTRLFDPSSPGDVMGDFLAAKDQATRFAVLRRNKGVADFMSQQILTDYNYSVHGADNEDEFVVLGPGARKGALAIAPTWKPERTHAWAVSAIREMPDCPRLGDRQPQLIDSQNCLCEFSKYARFASKPLTGKPYRPAHPGPQPAPVLPSHWCTGPQ